MLSKRLIVGFLLLLAVGAAFLVSRKWLSPRPPRVNLLLITLDTTRADRFGCYGNTSGLTPALDQLAAEGLLFERAYSPAPLTLPVHASLFTGLYPPEHGLRTNGRGRLPSSLPTLAQRLADGGYDTGAFVASFVLNAKFGLAGGFAEYDDDLSSAEPTEDALHRQRDGSLVVDSALQWLASGRSKPFFCWVHLYDPHLPYLAHEDQFGPRFRETPYDGEIAYVDRQVARLLSHLQSSGQDQQTLVVVVGDHGEGLGDHVELSHGYTLYNSTQHVPLIARLPNRLTAGRREKAPISLVDVYSTICGWLELPPGPTVSGRDLSAEIDSGSVSASDCYAATDDPLLQNGWSPLRSLTTERWKYIRTTRPELYDLAADPQESKNLAESDDDQVARMEQALIALERQMASREAEQVQLSAGERRALESLGYVGSKSSGSHSATDVNLPDVKDMLAHDAAAQEALDLLNAGELARARERLQAIVEASSEHVASRVLLGETYEHEGEFASAIEWYEAALKIKPDFLDALIHLGNAYAAQEKDAEAKAKFQEALEVDSDSTTARYNLGLILARQERFDEATRQFQQVLQVDPQFPEARVALANVFLAEGLTQEAVAMLAEEVAINRQAVTARLNLATLLAEKDPQRAYVLLREAVELEPENGQTQYNLGAFFLLHGRAAEAIAPLTEAVRLMPGNERASSELARARRLAAPQ